MKIFDVKWEVTTAGPSPFDNKRTELFLFGCERAKQGNPCPGCFNNIIWDDSCVQKEYTPEEAAELIKKHAPSKYITIGGGEPTDQIEELIELCKLLKADGFHIMVYTWRELKQIFIKPQPAPRGDLDEFLRRRNFTELLKTIDMLVDGPFMIDQRIYNEDAEDGAYNSVGSANQIVWDVENYIKRLEMPTRDLKPIKGFAMKDIHALWLDKDHSNSLKYILKDNNAEEHNLYIN